MKIEVNRFYRTRDGRKARIYATDGFPGDIVHGAILTKGCWHAAVWSRGGIAPSPNGIEEMPDDLISEWVEPAPKLKAWICLDDGLPLFIDDPSDRGGTWRRAPWLDEKPE